MTNYFLAVPRNCHEYGTIGTSGYYTIDPQKKMGGTSKFKALCNLEEGKKYFLDLHFSTKIF